MKKKRLVYGLTFALAAGSSLALAQESADPQGPTGAPPQAGKGHHGGKGYQVSPEERARRQERMREHLGLSDEQVQQMKAIRESDASREEKREQLRAVLTDEQRAKMDQVREQHRAAKQAGGKHYRDRHQDPAAYKSGKDDE